MCSAWPSSTGPLRSGNWSFGHDCCSGREAPITDLRVGRCWLPRPTPSGRSPALLNNLGGAHQHPPGPTHPRAASVIPSPPFTAAAAADRATPSEGAALTSKPFLHDVGPMLRRMSVVEQKTSTAGGNSTPMLGCRWENSTVRSRRSRRIKRLERRLAAAFSADGPGEYDPISKARFGAST